MSDLTRREAVAGLGMFAASGFAWSPASAASPADQEAATSPAIASVPSLAATAAAAGFAFGTAVDAEVFQDGADAALVRHHCRIVTPENALKLARLRREEGPADFRGSDRLIDFARAAGMRFHAHTLVWNDFNPPWVAALSARQTTYWLDRHINEVAGRYSGQIDTWDVVNEPFIMYSRKPGNFRDGPWYAAMGPDYIRRAFVAAAKADPKAKLALNEAFTENDDELSRTTREGLLRLVDDLKQKGVRLDVVGLQGHLKPKRGWNAGTYRAFLEALAASGVEICISELDCDDSTFWGDAAAVDRQVAEAYQAFLDVALSVPAVTTVQTWQLSDRYTFYQFDKQKRRVRAARTLPFDVTMQPKQAFDVLHQSFVKHRRG